MNLSNRNKKNNRNQQKTRLEARKTPAVFTTALRQGLTLSLPSRFVPSTELMVGASPRALGLVKDFSRDCMF